MATDTIDCNNADSGMRSRIKQYRQCSICRQLCNRPNTNYCSRCFEAVIPPGGKYRHLFNSSFYTLFTISVVNNGASDVTGHLEISPNGVNFMSDWGSPVTISPNELEAFFTGIFMQYTALVVTGAAGTRLFICIQGQY
ncbi:MAG TPA: hypothetical protein DCP97_03315 [Ruminococcaceae bacterium]|nr:hypothetical protein [Oscillospiraceae bacterium]